MLGLIPADNWEYGFDDFLRNLFTVFNGKQSPETILVPGLGDCLPIRSGRAAIITAIRALNLPQGARIAIPLYNCPVVAKSIFAAGCIPQFIDMDPKTYCMSADDLSLKIADIDAVVAVHMFGNMCDMKRILEISAGRPVIEDCAQAIGSKIENKLAGSFGSIAVLSFRSSKYLSVGEGGALFAKDNNLHSRIRNIVNEIPLTSTIDENKHVFKTYIRTKLRTKPLFGIIGYPIWNLYNKKVDFTEQTPITIGKMFKADFATIIKRLPSLGQAIEKQRSIARYYSENLLLDSAMLCHEKSGYYYNRFFYPIHFPSVECRDAIADYMFKSRINTIKPYQFCALSAEQNFNYRGNCPITENVAKRLLIIPSYYRLRNDDVLKITHTVNEGFHKYKTTVR